MGTPSFGVSIGITTTISIVTLGLIPLLFVPNTHNLIMVLLHVAFAAPGTLSRGGRATNKCVFRRTAIKAAGDDFILPGIIRPTSGLIIPGLIIPVVGITRLGVP